MPSLTNPGVAVFVQNKSQYVPGPTGTSVAIYTTASRGPVGVPTLITNPNDLDIVFGSADFSKLTYGLYAARECLNNTDQVWVIRVEETGTPSGSIVTPVSGVIAVEDGTATPKVIFNATAASEGDWVNSFSIVVSTMDTTNNTISFTVVDENGNIVESFNRILISNMASTYSQYFTFALSTDVAPWTAPTFPATYTTASTGGTLGADNYNGSTNPYLDVAQVATWIGQQLVSGSAMDDPYMYPAELFIAPGYCNALQTETLAVFSGMVSQVQRRGLGFVIPEISQGLAPTAAVTERATAGVPDADQWSANPYYPWLKEYDTTLAQTIELPPSGFVASQYCYNDKVGNKWSDPAGLNRGVLNTPTGLGTAAKTDPGSAATLWQGGINPIVYDRSLRSIYIDGDHTLTFVPSALDQVSVARMINVITNALNVYAKSFMYQPNDAQMWARLAGGIASYLSDIQARRGISSYNVVCDSTTNTSTTLARNETWCNVGIVPIGAARYIYIPIGVYRQGDLQTSA